MKFQLGDYVVSKKTGLPGLGKITAILSPKYYVEMYLKGADLSKISWNNSFPNWFKHPIVVVEYDEPRKNLTFQEYRDNIETHYPNTKISNQELKVLYKFVVPETKLIAYPIKDLELANELVTETKNDDI